MVRIPMRIAHLATGDWEVWCSDSHTVCILDHKTFADRESAVKHARDHVAMNHIEWNIDD